MRFSARNQSRIWYDSKTNTVRFPLQLGIPNHTQDVLRNPDIFGVDLAKLSPIARDFKFDYHGEVLYAAQQLGWVRMFIDFRNGSGTNVEGTQWAPIHKGVIWFDGFNPGMDNFRIALRTGIGDNQGDTFFLINREEIDFFKDWGKLLRTKPDIVGD